MTELAKLAKVKPPSIAEVLRTAERSVFRFYMALDELGGVERIHMVIAGKVAEN